MKTLALATALTLLATSAVAGEVCTDSFAATVKQALRTETFSSTVEFKTHDFVTMSGRTVLIMNGKVADSGDITHIVNVEGGNGSFTVVTGKIVVVDNKIIFQEFCADYTETAL